LDSSARTPRPCTWRTAHTGRRVFRRHQKSWKDDQGEWKDRTQWHNVIAYGKGFEHIAERLVKGSLVFVRGELTTREYDRTIQVTVGKKPVDHVIQQLVVELKADAVRVLDRNNKLSKRCGRAPPRRSGAPSMSFVKG
jgi:single-stranded DNA-binding protein